MTQKDLNTIFNITVILFEDPWFRDKNRTRDEVQDWVRKQLAESLEVYTVPVGMSWGVLTDKETYNKYIKKIKKIKYEI